MSESNRLLNFATSSELIANGEGRNVLSAIEDGLRNCDEFLISVAFKGIRRAWCSWSCVNDGLSWF